MSEPSDSARAPEADEQRGDTTEHDRGDGGDAHHHDDDDLLASGERASGAAAAARRRTIEHRVLAIALLASLVLWNLPFGGVLLYPFKLLGTWMHELSHGITMVVTGAGFDHMLVYRDTSGIAYARTSIGTAGSAVIAAAGYMGTPLWGAVFLVAAPTPRAARRALFALAILLATSALLVVSNPFGCYAIAACAVAFTLAAIALPPRIRVAVVQFVGAQACIAAVLDVRVLFRPAQVVDGVIARASDAHNMARLTFGTADDWAVYFWGAVWLAWSLAVLFFTLRWADRRQRLADVVA